jgi:hypothetical protein
MAFGRLFVRTAEIEPRRISLKGRSREVELAAPSHLRSPSVSSCSERNLFLPLTLGRRLQPERCNDGHT